MVLIFLHPLVSDEPGCSVSQPSLYYAFYTSRGPEDWVLAHVNDLMGLPGLHRGQDVNACLWRVGAGSFQEVCAADKA